MKLTEEEATRLIKEDVLDINLDMLTSALHDGEIDEAMEWIQKVNRTFNEDNFDNVVHILKVASSNIDNHPDAIIDWMIGIFVERKEG